MAENLHAVGAEVAVVEMAPQVMAPIDFSMAQIVHEHLVEKGVELHLGQGVVAFENSDDGVDVVLGSGRSIHADIIILSIGVRPATQLARDAEIALGQAGGIRVDSFMQTSAEGVYAVGDAVEFQHPLLNKPWLNLLAGPANRQARIAADNMVFGNHVEYEGSIGTAIAKVFDITVASTGVPAKRLRELNIPYLSATIHPNSHANYYPGAMPMTIKVVFSPDSGKLLGAQCILQRLSDLEFIIKRTIVRTGYTDTPLSDTITHTQFLGQDAVNILKPPYREFFQIVRTIKDEVQSILVVQEHHSLFFCLSLRCLFLLQKSLRLKKRIGITLYLRRLPRQIDTEAFHLLAIFKVR